MLLSYKWLRDFIHEQISCSDIADSLTMAGIEVESITHIGSEWNNIVVGEILQISQHPNADKLSLTKVKSGDTLYSVVCGATNILEGQKIALALEGAHLPNGTVIKKSKIRGQFSEGMICSEIELALGNDASGIMVLPNDAPSGTLLSDYFGLADSIFDISITPNRSDCLSVLGIAREISAIYNVPLHLPLHTFTKSSHPHTFTITVEVHDPDLCPRYCACLVRNVIIKPSPIWMQRRLINSGIRTINNIVDITNYVLLERGQPLHAFDITELEGNKIIVRKAGGNAHFITLDDIERKVPEDAVMICDGERFGAIGGIMGGQNSGITDATRNVLIESAYFSPYSIARTSKILNLKTEASLRFEKGVDIHGTLPSLYKAASLMSDFASGSIDDSYSDVFPAQSAHKHPITFSISRTNKITGLQTAKSEIESILNRLQFTITTCNEESIAAIPPTYRHDIKEPIDIAEEIARIRGYDSIPVTFPKAFLQSNKTHVPQSMTLAAKNILLSLGFFEVINYSFYAPEMVSFLNLPETDYRNRPLRLLNPLSTSQSVLRTSIIPSLLENFRLNLNNKETSIKIYELSKVFIQSANGTLPEESKRLSALMYGLRFDEAWNNEQSNIDFYDLKGCVESLLERLNISDYHFMHQSNATTFHPNNMLSLFIHDHYCGIFGQLHPDVLEQSHIHDVSVFAFDFDFDLLASHAHMDRKFVQFSRYPAVYRDISLIVDEQIPADTIYNTIASYNNKLIIDFILFDCFTGKTIPDHKKSLAFRIKYQSHDRTLTDDEVNKAHNKLLSFIIHKTGATLR